MAGSYNDGQVWVAELVGTTVLCVLGLGGIANAVLPGTKGHGIGFLGIAFCFGWGVFLSLQFVGHISGTYHNVKHVREEETGFDLFLKLGSNIKLPFAISMQEEFARLASSSKSCFGTFLRTKQLYI